MFLQLLLSNISLCLSLLHLLGRMSVIISIWLILVISLEQAYKAIYGKCRIKKRKLNKNEFSIKYPNCSPLKKNYIPGNFAPSS